MEIDPNTAAAKMECQGETYYFCSHDCHAKFSGMSPIWEIPV